MGVCSVPTGGYLAAVAAAGREKCAALHCLNPCGAQRSAGLMGWAQETREVPAPTGDARPAGRETTQDPRKKSPKMAPIRGRFKPSGPNDGANQCVIWRNRPPGGSGGWDRSESDSLGRGMTGFGVLAQR